MGRKKLLETRKQRTIRLTDFEWDIFKKNKMIKLIRKMIWEYASK